MTLSTCVLKVEEVRLIRTRDGIFKGFGYVNFEDADSLEAAIKLHGEVSPCFLLLFPVPRFSLFPVPSSLFPLLLPSHTLFLLHYALVCLAVFWQPFEDRCGGSPS